MTLSVCLIVKDEQLTLARCLNCVKKFADQIVVVDTGSSDNTVQIARGFTDDVYFFGWKDDFSAARNFAFEKAVCDYVMWLDADDVITDENCAVIGDFVKEGGFDMAYLRYAAAFEKDIVTYEYYRERIFKRELNYRFEGIVHEAVLPRGKAVYLNARIEHRKVKEGDKKRNLRIYQNALSHGVRLDERSQFYYGRELYFNNMPLEASAVLKEYLKGEGWKENKIEALITLYYCLTALGKEQEALTFALKTFLYDSPRPQVCCILGEYNFNRGDYPAAIYWYKNALNFDTAPLLKSGAFVNLDYSEFIPCLQLCVLYDRLGDYKTANAYNERAGAVKPQNPAYLYNKRYFGKKLLNEVNDD